MIDDPNEILYVELKPTNDQFVPGAMKVVGKTLRDFEKSGSAPKEAMSRFRDWLTRIAKNGRPIFVGFNAVFDWAFVSYYFHQFLGDNPFGVSGIDIKSYYMGMTGCSWEDARSSRIRPNLKVRHRILTMR